jgi:Peptidase family M28
MGPSGWPGLIPAPSYVRGEGAYPVEAGSEFVPPPRLGWKPHGGAAPDPALFAPDDPWGWRITEYEEAREIRPGLPQVARQVVREVARLLDGDPDTDIRELDLAGNPYWPPELAAADLPHERCVVLLPLALSRTQDDKGRLRWTLFGGSEQGPARPFWRGFFTGPGVEAPAGAGLRFFGALLHLVYGETAATADGLYDAGFRILPAGEPLVDHWDEGPLPGWARPFLLGDRQSLAGVKYLLTFGPFSRLPVPVRRAYLAGRLHLLPFPGSLVFWGAPAFHRLRADLPLALQIPLLHAIVRHNAPTGLRVPQEGFFHVPAGGRGPAPRHAGPVLNTFRRTHRWDPVHRDQDELAELPRRDEPLPRVLFSTQPDDLHLYDKPQARNAQVWTDAGRLVLDGPRATPDDIRAAEAAVAAGGLSGYRFLYPAMRVGRHEVYWHRVLAAYRGPRGTPALIPDAPTGYLTAYDADRLRPDEAVELWPRLLGRPLPTAIVGLYEAARGRADLDVARSLRKLADGAELFGGPLPASLARALLITARPTTLDGWLGALPKAVPAAAVHDLLWPVPTLLARRPGARVPDSLTYARTARRAFEVAYWKAIARLAGGPFRNKNNADCVRDPATRPLLPYPERQLAPLGEYLFDYYRRQIDRAGLAGRALVGDVPFRWETPFDYPWMGGWLASRAAAAERDLFVVIPGRDRGRAVVLADHYDTAFMEDRYYEDQGGVGARLAAAGADDNHSATAALMLAVPVLLEMSRHGRLGCDVWLVHLTGEEFPADCLGARALAQRLVEGSLALRLPGGRRHDLSGTRVEGVYVADMIAHNNDRDRDTFQIAPGTGPRSFRLAYHAHLATEVWNASVPAWNRRRGRRGLRRCGRSPDGAAVPAPFPHLSLSGEVRTVTDPRSTLYNTDAQIFSDAGVPVVLVMENSDIDRAGYHDTLDTMANIDLDYGAALAAILIEAVGRAACDDAGGSQV